MKQMLAWFNLQRDGTGNEFFNIEDTFSEILQLQMSVLHQIMSISRAGLPSLHDGWAKYIEKNYLMCQIPIKMLKQHVMFQLENFTGIMCLETKE